MVKSPGLVYILHRFRFVLLPRVLFIHVKLPVCVLSSLFSVLFYVFKGTVNKQQYAHAS